MGVVCVLIQIQEQTLSQLSDEAILELFEEVSCWGTSTREELLGYNLADEPHLPIPGLRPDEPRRPIPGLYLDKAWSELLLFITGREVSVLEAVDELPLASQAIVGGRPIGEPLRCMDPARVFWATEVEHVAEALANLSREGLRRRFFDPKGYPPAVLKDIVRPHSLLVDYDTPDASVFDAAFPDLVSIFDMLVEDLDRLTIYYRLAARRRNAMLIGFM